ncbi:AbrB/MazE/SpoVT family DNA-binding domain-containing protein [Candidatus Gottesmanbacteria bacterium]|nr:AbrB/MazE/SpoVT family DNA-binding domain-containing protein [Candidatus Gottesmanbacteria bacterium]MBI5465207.1 AbrB/MazE/SpoVT family DNA-binding domain-containing protein [Candidatus Gottesmanbacteria bacterium]
MLQKIIQVGNSLAVTIPKDFVREAGIKKGQKVAVETNGVSKTFLMKPPHLVENPSLTPEFFEWLERVGRKYQKAIIELAQK